MTVDDVIQAFASQDHTLPEEAIRWARAHWDQTAPRLLAVLDDYSTGKDRSDTTGSVLLMALFLMAERRDSRGYETLCRLLLDPELPENLLGDAVTESLHGIIIGLFNGDPRPVQDVIEATTADDFVRGTALRSLTYLVRTGALPDFDMRGYLMHLFHNAQPRRGNMLWPAWATAIATMGYADLGPRVRQLFSRGSITSDYMDFSHFEEDLHEAREDPTGLAVLKQACSEPIDDMIELMSGWWYYSEEARRQETKTQATESLVAKLPPVFPPAAADAPSARPLPKLGRNDPCPCGSGRKYKKCCLLVG